MWDDTRVVYIEIPFQCSAQGLYLFLEVFLFIGESHAQVFPYYHVQTSEACRVQAFLSFGRYEQYGVRVALFPVGQGFVYALFAPFFV